MGFVGAYFELGTIFVAAAALCIPALIALTFIRPEEIDYARARNARTRDQAPEIGRILDLCKNRSLVLFTAAIVLFQLADASMLPLIGENLARTQATGSSIWMSGLIIVPQIVVAILAPWVGYHSEKRGRKPLLLIGFGVEPLTGRITCLQQRLHFTRHRTAIVRHYRRRHWRIDCPCRHRPDRRHRTIQLGAGRRRR
jgi:predicted MFS family arabinose efflux permease